MASPQASALASDTVVSTFLRRTRALRPLLTRLFLFGSRARGDWRPDSDYDLLVVMPEKDRELIDRLYSAVQDILLETGSLISLKIYSRAQFERLAAMRTPFMTSVLTEGMELGRDDQGTDQGLTGQG